MMQMYSLSSLQTGLAEAWWPRVRDEEEGSEERRCAAHNLTECRFQVRDGKYAGALAEPEQ